MVQWDEPAVEARLGVIIMNIVFLLLGLYGYAQLIQERHALELFSRWEYFQSFDVEYAVLRGRLSFRWPLVSGCVVLRAV